MAEDTHDSTVDGKFGGELGKDRVDPMELDNKIMKPASEYSDVNIKDNRWAGGDNYYMGANPEFFSWPYTKMEFTGDGQFDTQSHSLTSDADGFDATGSGGIAVARINVNLNSPTETLNDVYLLFKQTNTSPRYERYIRKGDTNNYWDDVETFYHYGYRIEEITTDGSFSTYTTLGVPLYSYMDTFGGDANNLTGFPILNKEFSVEIIPSGFGDVSFESYEGHIVNSHGYVYLDTVYGPR